MSVLYIEPTLDVFHVMGTRWDSNYYEIIAIHGYGTGAPHVFSPVYPVLIKIVYFVVGNVWVSALLVTNLSSLLFPLVVYKTFGYKTALLAEVFPTYLVFTTIAYSDIIALVLLALAFFFLLKEKFVKSSLALSIAIFTFVNLALTLPAFGVALLSRKRFRYLYFFALPFLTGLFILLWFKIVAGSYFAFLQLEAPWGATFVTPLGQALYLACAQGVGSFTCQHWALLGFVFPRIYWPIRNIAFESFYSIGTYFVLRINSSQRVLLFLYDLCVILPILFISGTPAMSIPRLLLPAFPAFVGYSSFFKSWRATSVYVASCLCLAAVISVIEYFSFFA